MLPVQYKGIYLPPIVIVISICTQCTCIDIVYYFKELSVSWLLGRRIFNYSLNDVFDMLVLIYVLLI